MKIYCRGHSVIAEAIEKMRVPNWALEQPVGGHGDPIRPNWKVVYLRRGKFRFGFDPNQPVYGRDHRPGPYILICQGMQIQKKVEDQSPSEIEDLYMVNCGEVMSMCELFLNSWERTQIVVIGSEAAYTGSFNMAYSASKAAITHYVEHRRVGKDQQLVCIAPTMIKPSGMHDSRNPDGQKAAAERVADHPKGRWLTPKEVARTVLHCFENPYLTNTVIRLNGGEHVR